MEEPESVRGMVSFTATKASEEAEAAGTANRTVSRPRITKIAASRFIRFLPLSEYQHYNITWRKNARGRENASRVEQRYKKTGEKTALYRCLFENLLRNGAEGNIIESIGRSRRGRPAPRAIAGRHEVRRWHRTLSRQRDYQIGDAKMKRMIASVLTILMILTADSPAVLAANF